MSFKFLGQAHHTPDRNRVGAGLAPALAPQPAPALEKSNRVGTGLAPALASSHPASALAPYPPALTSLRTLLSWIRDNRLMLVNAAALIGTTAVTSLLGFVYWWLAARRFPPNAVGIASASVSAMVLLGGFCVLGLGTLLITELPRQPEHAGSLISTSLLLVGTVGGAVGLLFALAAPLVSGAFKELSLNLATITIFAAGVCLTATGILLDQALIGLLRGKLQFARNTLFALAKLLALLALSFFSMQRAGIGIYATWALGILLSLTAIAAYLIHEKGWPGREYLPRLAYLRQLGGAALQHHLLNMTLQAPILILPVLVTVLLSATMNAWFYVSWMIANFVFLVPNTLTIVLHASSSAQQASLARKARVTLTLGLATSLLANCVLQVAAQQALSLFGASYARQATSTLRVLLLAALPLTIKYHYIAICRVQDRIKQAMLAMLPGGLLELSAAALGAHLGGVTGLSAGWVAAISIEAAFMCRTVANAVRLHEGTPSPVILSEAKNLSRHARILRFAQNDSQGGSECVTGTLPQDDSQGGSECITGTLPQENLYFETSHYLEGEAIWRMDTISMPIVRLTAIKNANREIERRWNDYRFHSPWRINRSQHEEPLYPAPGAVLDQHGEMHPVSVRQKEGID